MILGDWFDQDWAEFLLPGLAALALAVWAWLADRQRMRRSDPDAVGLMPWTTISFWSIFATVLLLGVALRLAIAG